MGWIPAIAGAAAAAAASAAQSQCRYCGRQLDLYTRYCPECGNEVPRSSERAIIAMGALLVVSVICVFIPIFLLFYLNH